MRGTDFKSRSNSPSRRCALRKMSWEATRRSVNAICALAAAAEAEVTPGITSKSTPAARKAEISSPARPKIKGSPPWRRTTVFAVEAYPTSSA